MHKNTNKCRLKEYVSDEEIRQNPKTAKGCEDKQSAKKEFRVMIVHKMSQQLGRRMGAQSEVIRIRKYKE